MKRAGFILILIFFLGLPVSTSCAKGPQVKDITGHLPDLQFSLIDDAGHAVTQQDYHGENILLYFGYAGCSTQCPITMVRLSNILHDYHSNNTHAPLHVLFVSIDPGHDTPERLHRYMIAFESASMTGLTGPREDLQHLAKELRAVYPNTSLDEGDFPHSNLVYVFDSEGRARLLITPQDSDAAIGEALNGLSHD